MADETTIIEPSNEPSEAQKRITQLSEKVRLTSEERDEKNRLLSEQTEKTSAAEKERDFYAGFSDVVATNPSAKEYKDDILAKVKSGYTVEDATFAVLGKAGKLGGAPTLAPGATEVAGGSAVANPPASGAEKPITEMTLEEKRAKLEKEISWS